jgi:Protein of unknown function (DUF4065)
MAQLRDVMAYFCIRYPFKEELSKARLTKMVYLADWRSAITRGRQLTDVEWEFSHHGPYVKDVIDLARRDSGFKVSRTENAYGDFKEVISVKAHVVNFPSLTVDDQRTLDYVIQTTSPKYWEQFMKLVYSTYPIVSRPRFAKLDLVKLAEEYREGILSHTSR